jgi:hypothetical protein
MGDIWLFFKAIRGLILPFLAHPYPDSNANKLWGTPSEVLVGGRHKLSAPD